MNILRCNRRDVAGCQPWPCPNHYTTSNFKRPCTLFSLMCTAFNRHTCHTTLRMRNACSTHTSREGAWNDVKVLKPIRSQAVVILIRSVDNHCWPSISSRLLWHFDDFISKLNFKRLCGNAPVSLLQYMFGVSGSPYKLPKVATVRIRSYRKSQQSVFVPILNVATVGICTYWKLQQSSSKITLAPWKHVKLIHYLSSHVITHVFYLIYQ